MYNPIVKDVLMVRNKRYSTTEDGAIKLSIEYHCVDASGEIGDCAQRFGQDFYYALRDYVVIKLDNPSVEIV
jgi:hypothetical protein